MRIFNFIVIACFNLSILIYAKDEKIIQISVPKCGTNLLIKCLKLLTGKKYIGQYYTGHQTPRVSLTELKKSANYLTHDTFLQSHMIYSAECAQFLHDQNFKTIFIYRDPRDMVVSAAFYMIKHKERFSLAASLSFDDLITEIITHSAALKGEFVNIDQQYRAYELWLKDDEVLSIRFEDLIGEQGGGAKNSQYISVEKIAQHLDIFLAPSQLKDTIKKLFGGTHTFREGKIGSWRTYFNQNHLETFKKYGGQLLIDWGYEKDLNW